MCQAPCPAFHPHHTRAELGREADDRRLESWNFARFHQPGRLKPWTKIYYVLISIYTVPCCGGYPSKPGRLLFQARPPKPVT